MRIRVEVVSSFSQLQDHMNFYIPLRMDYFLWNFQSRYESNPEGWNAFEAKNNVSLRSLLDGFQVQKEDIALDEQTIALIKKRYDNGMWTLLLYEDNSLVGTARVTRRNDVECELHSVFVDPQSRGKKLGSLMLDKLLDVANNQGFNCMLLETLPHMNSAVKLYESKGFQQTSYIQFGDDTEELSQLRGSIFMKKILSPDTE